MATPRNSRTHAVRYGAGKTPRLTAGQNVASWSVIAAILQAYGGATLEELSTAVGQHHHPSGGRAFVEYCIRHGWLKPE